VPAKEPGDRAGQSIWSGQDRSGPAQYDERESAASQAMSSKTTHRLVVVQRKMYDKGFCVPFQEIYENMAPDEVRSRYAMVIDGELARQQNA
jgi:hypothetical protein